MAVTVDETGHREAAGQAWYAQSPEAVAAALHVDPAAGLSGAEAATLLATTRPERAAGGEAEARLAAVPGAVPQLHADHPGRRRGRVAARSRSGARRSCWSLLTVLNAVVGLRQEGKAESAMNALKSMMKATARVRRDGTEAEIPAEQLVVGDVVLLAAGDQVPADGRIVAANALQIDESALTGESVPAAKDAATLPAGELGPGDQTNMAFMNTPVTHGSGIMIVTGTGADTELGKISGHAVGDGQGAVAADQGAQPAHAVDRGGGRPDDDRDVRPRAAAAARRGTRCSSAPSRWRSRPSRRRCRR